MSTCKERGKRRGRDEKNKMDHFTFMENVAEQEKEQTQLTENWVIFFRVAYIVWFWQNFFYCCM